MSPLGGGTPSAPAVSVILPVFNGADFLATALDAALAQTYVDAEIIAVDDGSTDRTPELLASYGDRIHVIRQPNRRIAAARNAAIAVARGRYLAFLDADDVWEPTHLADSVARLDVAEPSVVGACSASIHVDRDGRPIPSTEWRPAARIGLRDLVPNNALRVSTTTVRRDAVLAVGGFDESIYGSEDWDLWVRLAAAGGWFVAVEGARCRIRWHGANVSSDPTLVRDAGLRVIEKFFASPALPADLRSRRQAFVATVIAHASWGLYEQGRDAAAAEELRRAAGVWPPILCDEDSLYAIICGAQPAALRAGGEGVDLEQGAARIFQGLAVAGADAGVDAAMVRRARGRAARLLARLAIGQGRGDAARRFVWQALRSDPALWCDPQTLASLAKALAGRRVQAWRRHLGRRRGGGEATARRR